MKKHSNIITRFLKDDFIGKTFFLGLVIIINVIISTVIILNLKWLFNLFTQVSLYNIFTHSNTIITVILLTINLFYTTVILHTFLENTVRCFISYLYTKSKNLDLYDVHDGDLYIIEREEDIWDGFYSECYKYTKYLFLSKGRLTRIYLPLVKIFGKFGFDEKRSYKYSCFVLRLVIFYPLNIYLLLFNLVCMVVLLSYNNPFDDGTEEGFRFFRGDLQFAHLYFSYDDERFVFDNDHIDANYWRVRNNIILML